MRFRDPLEMPYIGFIIQRLKYVTFNHAIWVRFPVNPPFFMLTIGQWLVRLFVAQNISVRFRIVNPIYKTSGCSSVGRAKDWKSLCRWFNPNQPQNIRSVSLAGLKHQTFNLGIVDSNSTRINFIYAHVPNRQTARSAKSMLERSALSVSFFLFFFIKKDITHNGKINIKNS